MSASGDILLGFDFGTQRIGVAVGETVTGSARPLETIAVRNDRPDWSKIGHLIGVWKPTRMVVGLPLNMDGSLQETTRRARRFGRQLAGRYLVPVDMVDERLTTREAAATLESRGRKVGDLDPVAAMLILESWMAENPAR